MNYPTDYDYEAVPPCKHCGDMQYRILFKGGQATAYCNKCSRYVKNLAKVHIGERYDMEALLRRKSEQIGGTYCQMCLRTPEQMDRNCWIEPHHVIEISAGGRDSVENVELLCEHCHNVVHSIRKLLGTDRTDVSTAAPVSARVVGTLTEKPVLSRFGGDTVPLPPARIAGTPKQERRCRCGGPMPEDPAMNECAGCATRRHLLARMNSISQ